MKDAFAKMNVWSIGGSAAGYHVLLGAPTVTKTETLKVPSNEGGVGTDFGVQVILANINWFDPKINALITKLKIPANSLPIFVTTQTYLLEDANVNDCCIGGYHSVTSAGQPYSMFTYISKTGAFSQDVSALSHELSEWVDDPYTSNNSPCGIYEVGDPLERETNYGDYPFVLNGVTYHMQDEALLPYFGGPTGVTLGNLDTMQGHEADGLPERLLAARFGMTTEKPGETPAFFMRALRSLRAGGRHYGKSRCSRLERDRFWRAKRSRSSSLFLRACLSRLKST